MPLNLLMAVVLFCTCLLLGRNLIELAVIAVIAGIAHMDKLAIGISPDILLSLLITVILLPTAIRLMDLDVDMRSTG